MANSYFKPQQNKLYNIFCENGGQWRPLTIHSNNEPHCDTQSSSPNTSSHEHESWQFFEIAENSYVLTNYYLGTIGSLRNDGSHCSLTTKTTINTNTAVFSLIDLDDEEHGGRWITLSVIGGAMSGCVTPRLADVDFLRIEPNSSDSRIFIKEVSDNPASLPSLDTINPIGAPTFDNDVAPPLYPATPLLMNTTYVPYFFVNDSTMNIANQIKQSPYYILNQYGQYKLSISVSNASQESSSITEEWQHGWSDSTSSTVSNSVGVSIGGSVEMNEIFAKETFSEQYNAQLSVSKTQTSEQSGSQSKQITATLPPNSRVAIYGVTCKFEMYQLDGVTPVAKPPTPMNMENGFLVVSEPITT